MTREIKFIDAERNLVNLTIEVENGRLSISGECSVSSGQILDEFVPADTEQTEIVEIWKEYHLKQIPEDVLERLEKICDDIEDDYNSDRLICEDDLVYFEDFDEPEKALAFAMLVECKFGEIDTIENESGNYWNYAGREYLFGTDEEMDDELDEYLDNYIDECVLPEIPSCYQSYFDDASFKEDCRTDGRGHNLASYDGHELYINYDGITYYGYKR